MWAREALRKAGRGQKAYIKGGTAVLSLFKEFCNETKAECVAHILAVLCNGNISAMIYPCGCKKLPLIH